VQKEVENKMQEEYRLTLQMKYYSFFCYFLLLFALYLTFQKYLSTSFRQRIYYFREQLFDFEQIYLSYFSKMKRFAREYVLSDEDAENIVQDVFLD